MGKVSRYFTYLYSVLLFLPVKVFAVNRNDYVGDFSSLTAIFETLGTIDLVEWYQSGGSAFDALVVGIFLHLLFKNLSKSNKGLQMLGTRGAAFLAWILALALFAGGQRTDLRLFSLFGPWIWIIFALWLAVLIFKQLQLVFGGAEKNFWLPFGLSLLAFNSALLAFDKFTGGNIDGFVGWVYNFGKMGFGLGLIIIIITVISFLFGKFGSIDTEKAGRNWGNFKNVTGKFFNTMTVGASGWHSRRKNQKAQDAVIRSLEHVEEEKIKKEDEIREIELQLEKIRREEPAFKTPEDKKRWDDAVKALEKRHGKLKKHLDTLNKDIDTKKKALEKLKNELQYLYKHEYSDIRSIEHIDEDEVIQKTEFDIQQQKTYIDKFKHEDGTGYFRRLITFIKSGTGLKDSDGNSILTDDELREASQLENTLIQLERDFDKYYYCYEEYEKAFAVHKTKKELLKQNKIEGERLTQADVDTNATIDQLQRARQMYFDKMSALSNYDIATLLIRQLERIEDEIKQLQQRKLDNASLKNEVLQILKTEEEALKKISIKETIKTVLTVGNTIQENANLLLNDMKKLANVVEGIRKKGERAA